MGIDEHVDGHLRHAAELARQRPFGAFAIGQHAAEHAGAGSGTRDLLDFLMAVDREQPDAERMRAGNVAFLLDGVAEGDAGGGRTGIQRHLDFGDGRGIEVGAHAGEQVQDFRRRVCLDGIVDRAVRHRMTESVEIVAHDIEVDHEAGAVGTSGGEEVEDALGGHGSIPSSNSRAPAKTGGQRATQCSRRNQPVETPEPLQALGSRK